jgi:alkaline phosphatase
MIRRPLPGSSGATSFGALGLTLAALALPAAAQSQTSIRIMPPERATFAVGQLFDIRVEASGPNPAGAPPRGLRVTLDGREITGMNILDPGVDGERGAGGTGATGEDLAWNKRAYAAPQHTTNFLVRDWSFPGPGRHTLRAWTEDGAEASVTLTAVAWEDPASGIPRVRNVILLMGDGMSAANRTAARIMSRGVTEGKADGLLAMDRLQVTGMTMTASLNSVITDSAPGMTALSTGNKNNNNQMGVFPDNTVDDAFDNPRVEYIGALLRRTRGSGFNVGIVTTADVTDATAAGNAVHTSFRDDLPPIAPRYLEEREQNGVAVLMGGGSRHFHPRTEDFPLGRRDGRALLEEFREAGFHVVTTDREMQAVLEGGEPPPQLLGLFHPGHMSVAFDKVGAGRYSEELGDPRFEALRDQPMLDDMTRAALRVLEAGSPDGFYLMVEGASIDKQSHAVDAERTIWDTIELDNAVAVALAFADSTNSDEDPDNDTLVIVASDHETGGLALVGVGNERYHPVTLGRAVRDYAAVFRFAQDQELNFFPNYEADEEGYPVHPDPSRKLLLGWGAAPDRYENWISNRRAQNAAVIRPRPDAELGQSGPAWTMAVANPARSGEGPDSDNRTVEGVSIPGFLVPGVIENRGMPCPAEDGCPADTRALAQAISGHTGSDVPIGATGPGAWQFTGTYDNTEVFLKMLRALGGSDPTRR